ncbi:MAG: ArsR/SmtB family transcription factor [Ferrimicrobium sp.]
MTGVDTGSLKAELDNLVSMMCKGLNDPKRLFILILLGDKSRTVGELAGILGSSPANVSQHLAVLRDRGIIEPSRLGTTIYYSLRHPRLLEAIAILRAIMADEIQRRSEVVLTHDDSPIQTS